jgi:uncharacterized protein YdeI (YjbR/CyaY-like superfamily)
MTKDVETYFLEGCGRCPLGGTPQCKVHTWQQELALVRSIVLDCGLTETSKWGVACYMHNQANVLLLSAFKDNCVLSFLKGSLISDTHGLLEKAGANSHEGRFMRFKNVEDIIRVEQHIKAYIYEAIEIEKAGLKVPSKPVTEYAMPDELTALLEQDPVFSSAFFGLTPGRQKGYILHFSEPKQAQTRINRIQKHIENILNGKGIHDDYKSRK